MPASNRQSKADGNLGGSMWTPLLGGGLGKGNDMAIVDVKDVATLSIGAHVKLRYPSSKVAGVIEDRCGRIEKILPHGLILAVENGFRTFNLDKIVGGHVSVVG